MKLQENISLKPYNTFGIDVSANFFIEVYSMDELKAILADDGFRHKQKLILGGGSNVLFTKDVDALVIHNGIAGIEMVKVDHHHVYIRSGAGVSWHDLVMYCVSNNFMVGWRI